VAYSLRSIARGSVLYASGQVLTKASAFLLIPLYTRFLTPEDYGIVGYLQFMLSILTTILMFGFYGAQTRFFYQYKNDSEVVGKYLFSINIWLIGVLTPCVFLVVFFGQPVYRFVVDGIFPDYEPVDHFILDGQKGISKNNCAPDVAFLACHRICGFIRCRHENGC